MDKSFAGCPLYVNHVDNVDFDNLPTPDGYVVESFFNSTDGMHWAKFMVTTEEGMKAIQNGHRLSNGYTVLKQGEGGKNHNVDYGYEVLDATYTHLAIVQNPRYEESIIMSPEQFKEYNAKKLNEIKNSKEKKEGIFMFKFFEKKEIANSIDVENAVVTLKNGQEMTVGKLVEMANKKNEDDEDEEKNTAVVDCLGMGRFGVPVWAGCAVMPASISSGTQCVPVECVVSGNEPIDVLR